MTNNNDIINTFDRRKISQQFNTLAELQMGLYSGSFKCREAFSYGVQIGDSLKAESSGEMNNLTCVKYLDMRKLHSGEEYYAVVGYKYESEYKLYPGTELAVLNVTKRVHKLYGAFGLDQKEDAIKAWENLDLNDIRANLLFILGF